MTKMPKAVKHFDHADQTRRNIPPAEMEAVLADDLKQPKAVRYPRNTDLDPQLMWRGKDQQDWSDLVVQAPPLYIQEKIHPRALVEDLLAQTQRRARQQPNAQPDLFGDFNGLPDDGARAEYYAHDQQWTNRMILGDSLQVMASLAEREQLRGNVQCIYFDPPYGIKFNSNFQWSTASRDVKDGNAAHITREPEQVKAFRDTWRDGIHSYLTYLRNRLTVARDLLAESGSIFVQIGDENVHRVRALMDEVFGEENFISQIHFATTTSQTSQFLPNVSDIILWYGRAKEQAKFRELKVVKNYEKQEESSFAMYEHDFVISRKATDAGSRLLVFGDLSSRSGSDASRRPFRWFGKDFTPSGGGWKTSLKGLERLGMSNRLGLRGKNAFYKRYFDDWPFSPMSNHWTDTQSGGLGVESRIYVVQTNTKVVERCILMATDPGDLVLDPTCGSGTTAYVAEQWGRRWITIDTSRVALALARARVMGARYPYYLLADSPEGQLKEAEVTRTAPRSVPTFGSVRQGFVYERVPHITLKCIANNAEIDVIWDKWQEKLEPLRTALNEQLGTAWEEWQIPREAASSWSEEARRLHADWWTARIARQREIDASIAAKAEFEYLYDRPYEDRKRVRVAGPFTVESLSPHRMLGVDEHGELIDPAARPEVQEAQSFEAMVLENLRAAGVQQADKAGRIAFTSLTPWPGEGLVCAEGTYLEGEGDEARERRAAIFIGSEFGTVQKSDLTAAAIEAAEAGFDLLIACAFNYEALATNMSRVGRVTVLKARMNADLHMAGDLKATGKGNLFVVFGEPDIEIETLPDNQIQVQVRGVDVFDPSSGEVRSDDTGGIACWFIDTDYNSESFFVRQAYFLGAQDPYGALKTTLKAEIDSEAWDSLNSDTSRPFEKPASGRIAVKVINHLGDEVMKVFRV